MSVNRPHDSFKPTVLGAFGASAIRDAIKRAIETGIVCTISRAGEHPSQGEIPYGLYLDLLEFFPPAISHFERIVHPESRSRIAPDLKVFALANLCQEIICRAHPAIRVLKESKDRTAFTRELMVWCAKAHAFLEHVPPEKRLACGDNLMQWEKDFLPELGKFFEILYETEKAARESSYYGVR